jgi:hypothetical protein
LPRSGLPFEPVALTEIGLGLIGLAWIARRRK